MNDCTFEQALRQNLERTQVFLKRSTKDFRNSLPFQRLERFYVTNIEDFERFQCFNFKTNLGKNKTAFSKNWSYHFLVGSTRMESTLFPYGTVTSEADVKTNRMRSTKWNYHTERSVSSNYSILLKNLFQFKNFLKRVDLMYQLLQCTAMYLQFDVHIRAFRKRYLSAGVLFERAFSH